MKNAYIYALLLGFLPITGLLVFSIAIWPIAVHHLLSSNSFDWMAVFVLTMTPLGILGLSGAWFSAVKTISPNTSIPKPITVKILLLAGLTALVSSFFTIWLSNIYGFLILVIPLLFTLHLAWSIRRYLFVTDVNVSAA